MSDVGDGEDLEFLRAFEDELYNDTLSIGSDDSLDSELEAELYQNVHFASSLIETPTNNIKEEKVLDKPSQSTGLESQIHECNSDHSNNQSDCEDGKPLDQIESPDDRQQIKDTSTNSYPEVELVFSKDEPKNKLHKVKRSTTEKLFEGKNKSDGSDNSLSDNNEWGLIAADLTPAKKAKKRNVRCFNCHERGHRTLECTQPKKGKICWLCGEVGHLRNRCKNELCFNCNEPGHQVKNCRKPRCRADDTCHRCHAYGHFESFCPDRWRQYHHTIKEGEIVRAMQPDSGRKNIFCYNCGEKGHLGHECLEDTQGFFDASFPFVVKYDRFTSNSSRININRNNQTNDNTDLTSNSPRNANKNNHPNDSMNQNDQNSKRSRKKKKKKRKSGEALDEVERSSKRRKVEDVGGGDDQSRDHGDDRGQPRDKERNYTEDNYDQMETFTDFNHATPNLPLQTLMSVEFGFVAHGKKRKRKRKNSQEQNQVQTDDVLVKKKKTRPNQQKRKKMKLRKLQQNTETINMPMPTENGEGENNRNKRKGKGNKINLESLSSTANFISVTSSAVHVSRERNATIRERIRNLKHDERIVVIEEPPKKPWKKEPKNAGDKRKVYFNYNGFL